MLEVFKNELYGSMQLVYSSPSLSRLNNDARAESAAVSARRIRGQRDSFPASGEEGLARRRSSHLRDCEADDAVFDGTSVSRALRRGSAAFFVEHEADGQIAFDDGRKREPRLR